MTDASPDNGPVLSFPLQKMERLKKKNPKRVHRAPFSPFSSCLMTGRKKNSLDIKCTKIHIV